MKKLTSLLLVLLMIVSMFSVAQLSAGAQTTSKTEVGGTMWKDSIGTLQFALNFIDNSLTISGEGDMPDFSDDDKAPWSNNAEDIKSIVVEDGVTSVGNLAFCGLTEAKSVTIGKDVKKIGEYAFADCTGVTALDLSPVASVGSFAFKECTSLEEVTFSDNLQSVDSGAFAYCKSLMSVTLPKSLTKIGDRAFGWGEEDIYDNFEIYGYYDTEAEAYADENYIEFNSLDEEEAEETTIAAEEPEPEETTYSEVEETEEPDDDPTEPDEDEPTEPDEDEPTEPDEDEPTEPDENETKASEDNASEYSIWVGGVAVNSDNAEDIEGDYIDGDVSYDPETNTLTLDKAVITGGYKFYPQADYLAAIYSAKDITIELVGKSTLKPKDKNQAFSFACLGAEIKLTGSGSADTCGVFATSFTISKGVSVYSEVNDMQDYSQIGIMAVNLTVGGTLDVTSTSIVNDNPAVITKNLTVSKGGFLKALAKNGISNTMGTPAQTKAIYLNNDSVVKIDGTVKAEAKGTISAEYKNRGYALYGTKNCKVSVGESGKLTLLGLRQAAVNVDFSLNKNKFVVKAGADSSYAKEIKLSGISSQKFVSIQPGTPSAYNKKANTLTVSASKKSLKAKALKKSQKAVKPISIKNAKGKVTVTKVKKGTDSKIFKKITVNKTTGAVTFKKGKYAKKTYKLKLKIKAAGNSDFKPKTITKTVKVKIK